MMYGAAAAFWSMGPQKTCTGNADCWDVLTDGLGKIPNTTHSNIIVIGDGSGNGAPSGAAARITALRSPGTTVLGYVSTRHGNLAPGKIAGAPDVVDTQSQSWITAGADGVYFDEAVLFNDVAGAKPLVSAYKTKFPDKVLMILAGQCPDPWVIEGDATTNPPTPAPDYALLWEETIGQYRTAYTATQPPNADSGGQIPAWWTDPANRPKIVHTVHGCDPTASTDWQDAIDLAQERNVGHLFVMDVRGGGGEKYDHLPSWWSDASSWLNSYNDHSVGLADHEILLAAHKYAVSKGYFHGWPNFEQRWYDDPVVQHRGIVYLTAAPGISTQAVPWATIQQANPAPYNQAGPPLLSQVALLWGAVHNWAVAAGFTTAMPTFAAAANPGEFDVITFAKTLTWLQIGTATPIANYQIPTFAEPGAVVRTVHRNATGTNETAFPTFNADLAEDATGRRSAVGPGHVDQYQCAYLSTAAPITIADELGTDLGAEIP